MAAGQPEPTHGWVDDARTRAVVDHGKQLYLAVSSRWGPHVTPQGFERKGRRLWIVIPRRSLKARAIAARSIVGGMIWHREHAAIFTGRARFVDPLAARGITSASRLADLPVALLGYMDRNRRHALGIVRDRPVPTLPLSRVAVAVDVTAMALLDGFTVAASWGPWARRDLLLRGDDLLGRPLGAGGLPLELHSLLEGSSRRSVLGWQTLSGIVALPARGDVASGQVATSVEAMALVGGSSRGPSCLTVDRGGYRLDSKRGFMVRGEGRARVTGDAVRVTVEPERVSYWVGETTGTVVSRPAAS